MFFTLIFGDNFFIFNYRNCIHDENCTEKTRLFLQKVGSLWRKQISVYIDEEFAINMVQPKFLSLLLTGKFGRGVTERVRLNRIFTSSKYTIIQWLYKA